MNRPLRILVAHPGASWSVSDVYEGLTFGLRSHGVEVFPFRLDQHIDPVRNLAGYIKRKAKQRGDPLPAFTPHDIFYKASVGVLEAALRNRVDAVLVVSAMFLHPDAMIMLRRAKTPLAILCTESPYDKHQELKVAEMIGRPDSYAGLLVNPPSGVWTNERCVIDEFTAVHPWSSYLPHAWHPARHSPTLLSSDADVAAHDVVFVGTGFSERVEWFSAIDWTGIDLGLYGTWERIGKRHKLRACVKGKEVKNEMASALYRRAKVNLNFYRQSIGFATNAPRITQADSLNPRAYELAACGAFHISDHRAEVTEKFGSLVPTFTTPAEAEALIRHWLADDAGRARVAAQLPACVAEDSWVHRARQVIGDLERLLMAQQSQENELGEIRRTQGSRVSEFNGGWRSVCNQPDQLDVQPGHRTA